MGTNKLGEFKILSKETVFSHRLLDLNLQTIETPTGKTVKWINIDHKGATAILPVDNDGKIILIKQYRNNANDYIFEVPAGCIELNEDPKECAIRELEEETGYRCKNIKRIFTLYPAVGTSNEQLHCFLATNLEKHSTNFDEDEFIETYKFSIDELMQMIDNGEIVDGKVITLFMAYISRKEFYLNKTE